MQVIYLDLDGDGAWPELAGREVDQVAEIRITLLEGLMKSGAPGIALRLDPPGRNPLIFQCSLQHLVNAVEALQARHELNLKRSA